MYLSKDRMDGHRYKDLRLHKFMGLNLTTNLVIIYVSITLILPFHYLDLYFLFQWHGLRVFLFLTVRFYEIGYILNIQRVRSYSSRITVN